MNVIAPRGAIALRRVLFAMLLAVVVYGGFAIWRGLATSRARRADVISDWRMRK